MHIAPSALESEQSAGFSARGHRTECASVGVVVVADGGPVVTKQTRTTWLAMACASLRWMWVGGADVRNPDPRGRQGMVSSGVVGRWGAQHDEPLAW